MKGMVARARRELGPGRARAWWAIAALCLFLLLALIAVDVMHRLFYTHGMFPRLRHWRFNSDADQSISEMVGYVQSLIAHGALLYLGVKLKDAWTHIVLGQTMLLIFLDDYLRLHETMRETFIDILGLQPAFGVRAEDIGELIAWAVLGIPALVLLVLAWRYSGERARSQAKLIVVGLAILVFFAVVVDMTAVFLEEFGIAPGAVGWEGRAYFALTVIESTGELAGQSIVMVLALYFLFEQLEERDRLTHPRPHAAERG